MDWGFIALGACAGLGVVAYQNAPRLASWLGSLPQDKPAPRSTSSGGSEAVSCAGGDSDGGGCGD